MSPSPPPPSGPSLAELAAGPVDDDDVRLLQQIAAHYTAIDPVPDGLVDRVQFGITLDALHAEIAELQRSADLVGVRSTSSDVQTITFTSRSYTVMITVSPTSADEVRIDGWVASGPGVGVEVRTGAGSQRTAADEDGRFVFTTVPRGLAQFVLRAPDAGEQASVVTPSIEL
jgi:hypothetical protein